MTTEGAAIGQLTYAAITAAQMYLDFAARAKTMTVEQANAEWTKVRSRSVEVNAAWDAGEPSPGDSSIQGA